MGAEDGGEDGAAKEAFGGEEVYTIEKQEQRKEIKEEEQSFVVNVIQEGQA